MITFRPVADHAVLVDFADSLSDAAHRAVLQLDQALAAHPFAGFTEAIPAFVNLLVDFDPLATDHSAVEAHLRALLDHPAFATAQPAQREVLVCYDDDFAPDLAAVAQQTGLSREAVIEAHIAGDYAVFLYGFAPGYAYLGGVPKAIQLDRKPAAVRGVAAGSVIIAGPQCLVTTLTMPTGWWIIGRSPTRILTSDPDRPFLFDVGDKVRFRRISRAEFAAFGQV
jgi:inhibitor of KinA